jgi:hypothetical protein
LPAPWWMLFSAARKRRPERRAGVQQYLGFLDIPVPEACVWEQLSEERRKAAIQMLARLMIQAVSASAAGRAKENEDERQRQQD